MSQPSHLYFIGIAGHAMRGLALASRDQGNTISGLDEGAVPPGSTWLDEHHITWFKSFTPDQLMNITRIIISGGTGPEHLALREAARLKLPVSSFAEYLGELSAGKHVISVAGTHGKTTTTSLITWILEAAGHHPDFLIGIRPLNFDSSARLSGSDVLVVEGDEYVASRLDDRSKVEFYHPDILVLTSVEHDHPDVFVDFAATEARFERVVAQLPADGLLVVNTDTAAPLEVAATAPCQVVGYGLESGDYLARNMTFLPGGLEFDIETSESVTGHIAVPIYGRHNVANTLAAVAVAIREGIGLETVLASLAGFKGAYRRFNILTAPDETITVIDDYAHHPTEVQTTLEAAKLHYPGRRIIAVFRPHTYTRTAALLGDYAGAFTAADVSYITDIEGAREAGQIESVSGRDVADIISADVVYEPDRAKLVMTMAADMIAGDVIIAMTVSGYQNLAEELVQVARRHDS